MDTNVSALWDEHFDCHNNFTQVPMKSIYLEPANHKVTVQYQYM